MAIQPHTALDNNLFLIKNETSSVCYMLLGKNYLSYVLSDGLASKIYSIRHFYTKQQVIGKNDFNDILNDSNLSKVSHYHIAIDSQKSTLVPNAFFDKTLATAFLSTLYDIENEEIVESQEVNAEMTNLFVLKKTTVEFLQSKLKNVTFYDANASLLKSYPAHIIFEHQHSIFLSIKDESFTLTLYKKNQLLLHKVDELIDANTVLYHIANTIKLNQIEKDSLGIQLHGESDSLEEIYGLLRNYYPYVRYATRIKELQYPDTLYAKPAHYFFNLFSLVSCAS